MTRSDPTVALLGATGFTGRLVAAELVRRGIAHRLGGRSAERLAAVPSPAAPRYVVELDRAGSIDAFLDGADVLITCVGPFTLHGMPVVEAAVRSRTPYVDSTGEFGFMAEVYERFANAESAVVPACGFDYVPGDLAAAVAVEELGAAADRVDVVYRLTGTRPTRGTARSAVAALGAATLDPRRLVLDGPDGSLSAVQVPWGEQVTVPRYVPGAKVRSGLVTSDVVSRVADTLAPAAGLLRPLTGVVRPLLERAAERLPEGPSDSVRGQASALVVARAVGAGREARVAVHCRDLYGLTARLLVAAALQVKGSGAMAPAQALPARQFLDSVSGSDVNGDLRWKLL